MEKTFAAAAAPDGSQKKRAEQDRDEPVNGGDAPKKLPKGVVLGKDGKP